MPSLLDIAPPDLATATVDIRGTSITVHAIRNRDWVQLMRRFPQLRRSVLDDEWAGVHHLETIPAIIAAGLGKVCDEAEERLVEERLSDQEQQQLHNAIMRLTNGPAPLAESPVPAGQVANGQMNSSPRISSS